MKDRFPWDDVWLERLRKLWVEDGWSASEIAAYFSREAGAPVSRSSIIGKVFRKKKLWGRSGGSGRNRPGPKPAPKTTPKVASKTTPKPKVKPMIETSTFTFGRGPTEIEAQPDLELLTSPAWSPLPGVDPVALMDLRPHDCRWPLDVDGRTMFCGVRTEETYCDLHRRRAGGPPVGKIKLGGRELR